MSLCDLNCCDLKWLQTKFDAINKKISDNQKLQDKINANIFKILKESGIDVEALLKNYYALNEEDYTKTLTSEDDINTLEPGTYKIVEEDMPQNAPKGFAVTPYDGTLIKSNNYMVLYESTGFHFAAGIPIGVNTVWAWYDYAPYAIIKTLLFNYMQIRSYDKFQYDDVHKLTGFAAGVYNVDATVANLPVQTEGLLIIRQGVNKSNNYIVMFLPQNSNDVYRCFKNTNGSWSEWEQVAFLSDVPSLTGYATQEWVNQQIQDITGGSVTADWVKSNYYALTTSQYNTIPENTDFTALKTGCYYGIATNFTDDVISSLGGAILLIKFNAHNPLYYRAIIYDFTKNKIYFFDKNINQIKEIAYSEDIPSLSGYATQSWVQSQNYLTAIPDEYVTNTELTAKGYQTATQVNALITAALNGYATQSWVSEQIAEITGGAVTSDMVSQMITEALEGYATETWVTGKGYQTSGQVASAITEALVGYATQSWVNGRGYQTATQVSAAITAAITGYATEQYVNKNYLAIESTLYSDIPENADLNNYTTVGNYFCSTSVKAGTLKNTPKGLNYAFKLTYEEIAANNQAVQKIVENSTGNEYIRVKVGNNWGDWTKVALMTDIPSLSGYASQEWVQQQGYQTVQQVNSLINTATADMLTQEDLDTFNYATENWVLQTALAGYATENWVNTKLNDYLPKQQDMSLTTQGTYYGLQYQWARYGQVVEVFLVGNLTQEISNQLISNFCPANPMRTLQTVIPGYDDTKHYAEFNNDGLKLMGSYQNELYINCHFTYLTNE